MKVLVLGGTRFNGIHLVWALVQRGHQVSILTRGIRQAPLPPEVRWLKADRTDPEQLRRALGDEEFDAVIDSSAYTLEELRPAVDLLEGRSGHYIFYSTTVVFRPTEVYPITEEHPIDRRPDLYDYPRNKILSEDYLRGLHEQRGFPYSIVRFGAVYGPHNFMPHRENMMFVRLLRGRKILIPGRGEALTHLGYSPDQAEGVVQMLGNPRTFGESYILTGPNAVTANGYVDIMARVVGVEPVRVHVPAQVMDEVSPKLERPFIVRTGRLDLRWSENIIYSIQKSKEHFGYAPAHDLEAGMRETFEWFQREGLAQKLEYNFSLEDELIARYA